MFLVFFVSQRGSYSDASRTVRAQSKNGLVAGRKALARYHKGRIDALDEDLPSGRKARCLGYTLLNLFHAPGDNKAQPADEQSQGYCLNQGGWQLPIYTRPHPHVTRLRWDDLNSNKKWLGCSVLLRVQPAPTSSDGLEVLSRATVPKPRWAALGLDSPAPPYNSGAYDSSRCSVGALDRELFKRRRRRV